jgi:hypothetical protein
MLLILYVNDLYYQRLPSKDVAVKSSTYQIVEMSNLGLINFCLVVEFIHLPFGILIM